MYSMQSIYFDGNEDPFDLVSNILKKNNISETTDEYVDKLQRGETSAVEEVYIAAKSLRAEKISEGDAPVSLSKILGISPTIAQNIIHDVEDALVPQFKIEDGSSNISEKPITPATPPSKKSSSQTKKDSYREPVE